MAESPGRILKKITLVGIMQVNGIAVVEIEFYHPQRIIITTALHHFVRYAFGIFFPWNGIRINHLPVLIQ